MSTSMIEDITSKAYGNICLPLHMITSPRQDSRQMPSGVSCRPFARPLSFVVLQRSCPYVVTKRCCWCYPKVTFNMQNGDVTEEFLLTTLQYSNHWHRMTEAQLTVYDTISSSSSSSRGRFHTGDNKLINNWNFNAWGEQTTDTGVGSGGMDGIWHPQLFRLCGDIVYWYVYPPPPRKPNRHT